MSRPSFGSDRGEWIVSEFEMVMTLREIAGFASSHTMNFVSILSAYLLVGWFLAHQLTRAMAGVLTAMFAVYSLFSVFQFQRVSASLNGISDEIRAYAGSGQGLEWHASATTSQLALGAMPLAMIAIMVSSVALAIFFFYHSRRTRKVEAAV